MKRQIGKLSRKQNPPLPGVQEVGQSNGFQVMGRVCAYLSFKRLKLSLNGPHSDPFHQALEPHRRQMSDTGSHGIIGMVLKRN